MQLWQEAWEPGGGGPEQLGVEQGARLQGETVGQCELAVGAWELAALEAGALEADLVVVLQGRSVPRLGAELGVAWQPGAVVEGWAGLGL